jgi:hypothetical protein
MRDPDAFLQIYFSKSKGRYGIKALPNTARDPTPAQIEVRRMFGESARAARGRRREPGGLPPAAVEVRQKLAGTRSDRSPLTGRNFQKRMRELAERMIRRGL